MSHTNLLTGWGDLCSQCIKSLLTNNVISSSCYLKMEEMSLLVELNKRLQSTQKLEIQLEILGELFSKTRAFINRCLASLPNLNLHVSNGWRFNQIIVIGWTPFSNPCNRITLTVFLKPPVIVLSGQRCRPKRWKKTSLRTAFLDCIININLLINLLCAFTDIIWFAHGVW